MAYDKAQEIMNKRNKLLMNMDNEEEWKRISHTSDVIIQGQGGGACSQNTVMLKKDTITNNTNTFNITFNINGNDINKEEIKSFFQQLKELIK